MSTFPAKPFSIPGLPYANHVHRLPAFGDNDSTEAIKCTLSAAYLALLDLLYTTLGRQPSGALPPGPPSYNIILTLSHLHLVPRLKEKHLLTTGYEISVNSLGFAGLLLVQCPRELEAVQKEKVMNILSDVGLPKVDVSLCEAQMYGQE